MSEARKYVISIGESRGPDDPAVAIVHDESGKELAGARSFLGVEFAILSALRLARGTSDDALWRACEQIDPHGCYSTDRVLKAPRWVP